MGVCACTSSVVLHVSVIRAVDQHAAAGGQQQCHASDAGLADGGDASASLANKCCLLHQAVFTRDLTSMQLLSARFRRLFESLAPLHDGLVDRLSLDLTPFAAVQVRVGGCRGRSVQRCPCGGSCGGFVPG